jgi:hypothetical protein
MDSAVLGLAPLGCGWYGARLRLPPFPMHVLMKLVALPFPMHALMKLDAVGSKKDSCLNQYFCCI